VSLIDSVHVDVSIFVVPSGGATAEQIVDAIRDILLRKVAVGGRLLVMENNHEEKALGDVSGVYVSEGL
jgi:hypothetical protein